eukprot:6532011-Pyramimonas_sp.AAC.3
MSAHIMVMGSKKFLHDQFPTVGKSEKAFVETLRQKAAASFKKQEAEKVVFTLDVVQSVKRPRFGPPPGPPVLMNGVAKPLAGEGGSMLPLQDALPQALAPAGASAPASAAVAAVAAEAALAEAERQEKDDEADASENEERPTPTEEAPTEGADDAALLAAGATLLDDA